MKMKTVLTISMSLLLIVGAQAQKPNISKAKTLWEQGKLDEAKAMIDEATTYEKTMNDGKTWYYRGLIYATIDTTTNEAFASLKEGAMDISLASFAKANELDNGKGYVLLNAAGIVTMDQQISGYFAYYFTKAIESYEQEDFGNASTLFETAAKITPGDTSSLTNAAYAAQINEDYDRALGLFERSIENGAQSLSMFTNIISLYKEQDNIEKALETIAFAKNLYPSDNSLNRTEISILIDQGRADEAINKLKLAIENEPNDHVLYFAMGILQEELKNVDMAIESYDKALEIKADHYESAFNKAAILFNRANLLYKEKGLLGYSQADQKKAKELDPKIKEGFQNAVPAWEKVYSIKPTDRSALETLVFLYAYMGEEKKADKVEAELNALGESEEDQ